MDTSINTLANLLGMRCSVARCTPHGKLAKLSATTRIVVMWALQNAPAVPPSAPFLTSPARLLRHPDGTLDIFVRMLGSQRPTPWSDPRHSPNGCQSTTNHKFYQKGGTEGLKSNQSRDFAFAGCRPPPLHLTQFQAIAEFDLGSETLITHQLGTAVAAPHRLSRRSGREYGSRARRPVLPG